MLALNVAVAQQPIKIPDEPEPVNPIVASPLLKERRLSDCRDDKEMARTGYGQLFGQFLLDRNGVIRWTFTEVAEDGNRVFDRLTGSRSLDDFEHMRRVRVL